jgi:tetratricopeptide (TPR) repeat protein
LALEILGDRFKGEGRRLLGVSVLRTASNATDVNKPKQPLGWVQYYRGPLDLYLRSLQEPELQRRIKLGNAAEAGNGLLQRLLDLRVLRNRLTSEAARARGPAQRQADREWALKYVRQNRSSPLGWASLTILQEEGGGDEDFRRAVARASKLFEDVPGLGYAARYEQARGLLKTGRRSQAAKRFRELYAQTLDEGQLPRIDASFREALREEGQGSSRWAAWVRQTAALLTANRRRPEVVALAWQCWELGNQELAARLLADVLDRSAGNDQRREVTLTVLEYLCQTCQYDRADELLRSLEAEPAFAHDPAFWRLATMLAAQRQQPARIRTCLEQALEREYQQVPEVFDLRAVRNDYRLLLSLYQQTAGAMATLEVEPPEKFVNQVVRTADRWRMRDPDDATACWTAGWILQTVGRRDLAWDYFTTALTRPAASVRLWPDLVRVWRAAGERELADRACAAAFDAEPTNTWILRERAEILQELGRTAESRRIVRQIANGTWPPGGDSAQKLAREYLEGR